MSSGDRRSVVGHLPACRGSIIALQASQQTSHSRLLQLSFFMN